MSLLATLRRQSLRRGVLGGSRFWLVLGGAAWTLRALQWALRSTPERVYRGDLRPGEVMVITNEPAPPSRRRRRKQRRAELRAEREAGGRDAKAARRAAKRES